MENEESVIDYWIYAPGKNARLWEEFYTSGIMGIGWHKLGDLSKYKSQEEIAKRLRETYDQETSKSNDSLTCYNFVNSLKKGDIILPKKGKKMYLGFGIVQSEYIYDDSRKEYKNIRRVKWIKKGEWLEDSGNIVLKTLTKITQYEDYVRKLKTLIGIETQPNTHDLLMTNSKNQILYGPPGTGKTFNTKKMAVCVIENE